MFSLFFFRLNLFNYCSARSLKKLCTEFNLQYTEQNLIRYFFWSSFIFLNKVQKRIEGSFVMHNFICKMLFRGKIKRERKIIMLGIRDLDIYWTLVVLRLLKICLLWNYTFLISTELLTFGFYIVLIKICMVLNTKIQTWWLFEFQLLEFLLLPDFKWQKMLNIIKWRIPE